MSGISHTAKGSFLGGKIGKPSLDSIGGWLEGRFTKLVTGDDSPAPNQPEHPKSEFFSQYSEISSTTTSATASPQPGPYAPYVPNGAPRRSESSVSLLNLPPPSERSASATDYTRRRQSPPMSRIASASAATTTFAQSMSFGQAMHPAGPPIAEVETPRAHAESNDEGEGQDASWWGASSYANGETSYQTPTATSFMHAPDGLPAESADGFISLMDTASPYSTTPVSSVSHTPRYPSEDLEEDEDLGFGNAKPKPARESTDDNVHSAKPATASSSASAPERPGKI